MASHEISKLVDGSGDEFNFRDPTKESLANKVTSVRASSSATDTNYPSEKAVAVALENVAPGAITTDVTIANGDKMIISDASDSSKMKRASAAFDGSSSGVLLSKKGTFEQPKEAYLEWGGKNISGGYGPIDAAMVGQLGACRTAFGKAAGVTIEYTRDGGETWVDYEASDSTKVALFTTSASIGIGKCDATHKATSGNNWQLYKTRIRILSPAFGLYTNLNKFVILVSTNGSSGCQVVIRSMTRTNEEGSQTWTDMGTATVSGWSGYNVINTSAMTTWSGGASQKSQNSIIEFLFEATQASANDNYNGLQIISIYGYGGVGWTCPSAMAKTGHLYSFDAEGNATFPKAVTAESFTGKFTTARTIGISGPVTGTATPFDGSANITIPVTKVGYGVTNATSAYPFGAASLCGPRSGDDSLPYVQWSQFTGKAFTVGGTTYYGYVLAPSSSVTVTYGGSTATVTNSHATNYNVIIVIEDATYLGSATFTGRDRCAPTLDGVGFRRCNIADNVAVGTGTAVVVNVGGGFTMPSATSNSKLLAAKAVSSVDYTGNSSVASGAYSVASGYASVASGISSVASGAYSVASGYASVASGLYSVASGYASVASGRYSVASGNSSVASGAYSVASGLYSVASQDCSFVSAIGGLSGAPYQTVIGKNNVQVSNAAFVIGWGADESNRKNIAWVGTDGDIYFKEGQTGLTAQLAAKAALNHVHNTDANEVTDSAAASTLDVVTDTTEIVTTNTAGYGNSSTQDKKLYRRPIKSKLWPWIKGLLSSDTGVNVSGSSASCTGNAATASAAASGSALETAINGKAASSHTHKTDAADVTSDDTNLGDAEDTMQFVTTDAAGYDSSHKPLYRRPALKIWNWIKSKLASDTGYINFEHSVASATNVNSHVLAGVVFADNSLHSCMFTFVMAVTFNFRESDECGGILKVDVGIGTSDFYVKNISLSNVTGALSVSDFNLVVGEVLNRKVVGVTWNGVLKGTRYLRGTILSRYVAGDDTEFVYNDDVANGVTQAWSSARQWADDSAVVHIAGSETITGAKEFSRSGQDTNFTDSSGAESIVRARTATNSNNGSCQLDAYASGGKYGLYARNSGGAGKWVANLDNDGVVNLGSSGDAVRIGGTKFVFGASQLGTDSNTFYWV